MITCKFVCIFVWINHFDDFNDFKLIESFPDPEFLFLTLFKFSSVCRGLRSRQFVWPRLYLCYSQFFTFLSVSWKLFCVSLVSTWHPSAPIFSFIWKWHANVKPYALADIERESESFQWSLFRQNLSPFLLIHFSLSTPKIVVLLFLIQAKEEDVCWLRKNELTKMHFLDTFERSVWSADIRFVRSSRQTFWVQKRDKHF